MSDLVEFLKARLDEDEAVAKAAGGARWEVGPPNRRIVVAPWEPGDRWSQPEYVAAFVAQDPLADGCRDHIVRHDPARVLREVEAKRRLLDEHPATTGWDGDGTDQPICLTCSTADHSGGLDGDPYPCLTLRLLALSYADHKDYRAEWAA